MSPSLFTQTRVVLQKDLLLSWRGRARVVAMLSFAVVTLMLFSFAVGPNVEILARHAGGYLWLALLLSSVLALGQSFALELEDAALEGLALLPVDPRALFFGKAIANTLQLFFLGVVLVPLSLVLYSTEVEGSWPGLLGLLFAGTAGLAAPGTLYSAMTSRAKGKDVMLPLLLFPLVVPVLLAATKGTNLALMGDPMNQIASWATILVCFDLVYWSLCPVLFGRVLDD
ncbi:MAG: heme exporter protein CcmB [Deltaproteobacteria bacterium]|nr:heme exporter protein CcmB [Deltaproteobacteria bacterium]